jgi:hypothetical protein
MLAVRLAFTVIAGAALWFVPLDFLGALMWIAVTLSAFILAPMLVSASWEPAATREMRAPGTAGCFRATDQLEQMDGGGDDDM